MRVVFVLMVVIVAGCRAPYSSEVADWTVLPETFPPTGTPAAVLDTWFNNRGYAPGPKVHQAEANLRRRPGDPLVYARQAEKDWWATRSRSVRDLCVTTRTIYYKLDPSGALMQAIQTHRSQC